MESLKEKVEEASCDKFIDWFNKTYNRTLRFEGRAGAAPDLIYADGSNIFGVEHTGAYYDRDHACFIWEGARNPDVNDVGHWEGMNPDASLADAVINCIKVKSAKDYGKNCILLVEIPPGVTSNEKLEKLLNPFTQIEGMEKFIGIYVAGAFPYINGVGGGYHVLTIKSIRS